MQSVGIQYGILWHTLGDGTLTVYHTTVLLPKPGTPKKRTTKDQGHHHHHHQQQHRLSKQASTCNTRKQATKPVLTVARNQPSTCSTRSLASTSNRRKQAYTTHPKQAASNKQANKPTHQIEGNLVHIRSQPPPDAQLEAVRALRQGHRGYYRGAPKAASSCGIDGQDSANVSCAGVCTREGVANDDREGGRGSGGHLPKTKQTKMALQTA